MIKKRINKTNYLSFSKLSGYSNLINFVSTRESGDMVYNQEKPEEYIDNRRKFLNLFEIELENAIFCEQVHKDRVEVVDNNFFSQRSEGMNVLSLADGLITNIPNICLVVRTSDCVPIIIYDPLKNVLGVAHSGWRGTLVEIAKRTVEKMQDVFGVIPSDLVVGIGPSLGPKDFFVRHDVETMFRKKRYGRFLTYKSPDQWLLNLWGIIKKQLIAAGVNGRNIEISNISTYSSDFLFSHRKKDGDHRFITGAMIK